MLADQIEALGVIEQRGQADQVGAHGTFVGRRSVSPINRSPPSSSHSKPQPDR
jgi:hypothetical protein